MVRVFVQDFLDMVGISSKSLLHVVVTERSEAQSIMQLSTPHFEDSRATPQKGMAGESE